MRAPAGPSLEARRRTATLSGMKVKDLTVGMKVKHPQYGEGVVQKVSNVDATLLFVDQLVLNG